MEQESSHFASVREFSAQYASLLEAAYAQADATRWALPQERFTEALRRSVEKRFRGASPGSTEVEAYLKSLHLEDLALACACSAGIEAAWEFFVAQFRAPLRAAARAILHSSSAVHASRSEELADALYADLYGLGSADGSRRKSLFEYFHGRSKLSTWLRAVLAQRHVDLLRSGQRIVSLDSDAEHPPREVLQRSERTAPDPDRARYLAKMDDALAGALDNLTARERLLISCYYADQITLAEIGRMVGEHESTISRQLGRTRRRLREMVTTQLLRGTVTGDGRPAEPGLDAAQVELAFEYVCEDWPFDLSRALASQRLEPEP